MSISEWSFQTHRNCSQNSQTLLDAPYHHSWSISHAFTSRNPVFENLRLSRFPGSGCTQPIPKFFKPSRPLIKFKSWLKLSTAGSFQLPERSISTGTHLQSALYGLQYRRIWMMMMRLADERFPNLVCVWPLDRKAASRRWTENSIPSESYGRFSISALAQGLWKSGELFDAFL